jgi:hypothetical protein
VIHNFFSDGTCHISCHPYYHKILAVILVDPFPLNFSKVLNIGDLGCVWLDVKVGQDRPIHVLWDKTVQCDCLIAWMG